MLYENFYCYHYFRRFIIYSQKIRFISEARNKELKLYEFINKNIWSANITFRIILIINFYEILLYSMRKIIRIKKSNYNFLFFSFFI